MIERIVATVLTLVGYAVANMWFMPQATLIAGPTAGRQFENSDEAYLTTIQTFNVLSLATGALTLLMLAFLLLIWWRPIRQLFESAKKAATLPILAIATIAAAMLAAPNHGRAFFEKTDRTEIVPILPNESAFWIPDVGDVKGKQVQMNSEEYLNANKIALRRFQIPHVKLEGSAGRSLLAGWDYFVPAGRMIKVDRTPFSREWVDATDRGTSKSREGFPCQSNEGLNITVGVSIGTSVSEADAAKFLYRFGVHPPRGEMNGQIENDGRLIFTSVYYGRSLKEVMDDVGRKYVQTVVCSEINNRTFDKTNEEANTIMDEVRKNATAYFASVGITLDFIGWADNFEFDSNVQLAVNRKYIAMQDEIIAKALAPHTGTIQALAAAEALRSFGSKTDGKLPTTIVGLPTNLNAMLESLLRATAPAQ